LPPAYVALKLGEQCLAVGQGFEVVELGLHDGYAGA